MNLDRFHAEFGVTLDSFARDRGFTPEKRSIENPNTPIDANTLGLEWGGAPTKASVRVSSSNALQQVVVWACNRVLGETIGQLPLHVYRRTKAGKEIARDHRLYPMLHGSPNSLMTAFTYRELVVTHCNLWGPHYAFISQRTEDAALIVIPPWMVRHEWRPNVGLRYIVEGAGEQTEFEPRELIHVVGPSLDGISSMSPVMMAAREAIGLALATEEHGARFFANGARIGGVLTTDLPLEKGARDRIRQAWAETQQGLSNAYRTAVLEQGLKWQAVGMQSDHAQLEQTRRFQVEEICRAFRVPPSFVQDHTRSTFSNSEQQDLHFAKHTIAPWCARIEQEFNRKLFADDPEHFCEFNLDGLMRGDFQTRTNGYKAALGGPGAQGYMTINEVRALENLPPVTGGDKMIFAEQQKPAKPGDPPEEEPA